MNRDISGIGNEGFSSLELEYIRRHHRHEAGENQCSSALVKHIRAPVPLVIILSLLNLFDCASMLTSSCMCI